MKLKTLAGVLTDGIRFYDDESNLIFDLQIADPSHEHSEWSAAREIAPGYQIIGLKCNSDDNQLNISYLDFIIGRIF